MSEACPRKFWQINLSTILILVMISSAITAKMCTIPQFGRAISLSGRATYGTPMPTYIQARSTDGTLQRTPVPYVGWNIALNSIFWLAATVVFYFVMKIVMKIVIKAIIFVSYPTPD